MLSIGSPSTFPAGTLPAATAPANRSVEAAGLDAASAVGQPGTVALVVSAPGLAATAIGAVRVDLVVSPAGAGATSALGATGAVLVVAPAGVASAATTGEVGAFWSVAGTGAGLVYLLTIEAYAGDGRIPAGQVPTAGTFPAGTWPAGSGGLSGVTTLLFSDQGFTSRATDDPPHAHYVGRASVPLTIERAIPLTPENDRRISLALGEAEIDNPDGVYDDLPRRLAVDGRPVQVHLLDPSRPLASRSLVFAGTGTGWWADDGRLRIGLRDAGYLLDVPLQPLLYAGTGGPAGSPEIRGRPVPQSYGLCRNVSPVLVDPANLVFQAHDRRIKAVPAVRDRGAPLGNPAVDHPDYASLIAASIAPGTYHTCLALGLFRVAFLGPQGRITADVEGDAAGGYVADTAGVVLRVILERGGIPAERLDLDSFAALSAELPGTIGIHFPEPTTVAAACGAIMGHCAGYWGARRDGRFAVGRLAPPEPSDLRIRVADVRGEVERLRLPETIDPPNRRRVVGFRRNWTLQADGYADGADVAFLSSEWRYVAAYNDQAAVRHLMSTAPPPLASLFDAEADAQALADYLVALYAPGRGLFRVPVDTLGHRVDLGRCVSLTWPRHAIGTDRPMRVIHISERGDERGAALTLFG